MSLKLKALLQLVGLMAAGAAGGLAVSFVLKNFTPDQILAGIQIGCLGGLLYICYGLILSRLESAEKFKETMKKD